MRDIPAVTALVSEYWAFEGIPQFDAGRIGSLLERVLSQKGIGGLWVAQTDAVIGYLVACFILSLEHGGVMAEIDEFYVAPDARSGGVGGLLLAAAEQDLKRSGCVCVQLQLGCRNQGARDFYRRHGYRERAGFELLDKRLSGT